MKTLLAALVLGFGVAGLQAIDDPAVAYCVSTLGKSSASSTPTPDKSAETQAAILAEMKKQTAILQSQKPIITYDPTERTVPVTQVPVR